MSSSHLSRRIRRCFIKEERFFSKIFLYICCISTPIVIIIGSFEIYKLQTYAPHQCQVKVIDIIQNKDLFYPRWTIQVHYEDRTKIQYIIDHIGLSSASKAWTIAEKYMINQAYPCRHSSNQESDISWTWESNKPSKLKAFSLFFMAAIFVVLCTGLQLMKICCTTDERNTQEQLDLQNEPAPLYSDEELQQSTTPPESPPPSYDQVIQQIERTNIRI